MAYVNSSTGARKMFNDAFKTAFDSGFIDIYAGSMPASPNTSSSSTLLGTASSLAFTSNADGTLSFTSAPTFTGLADGTASWCRFRSAAETTPGSTSTTLKRFDGLVGSGGILSLSSNTIVTGAVTTINTLAGTWAQ